MAPRKLAAGNWKMNGTLASLAEIGRLLADHPAPGCDVLICPPATLLHAMAASAQGKIALGGQDCHAKTAGAHTGDIAAAQLRDAGASHVILGHSERRTDHAETDAQVAAKSVAAHEAGLVAVICVGETEAQRDAGQTLDVISAQLAGSVPDGATAANTVIAYEPVWAIGTGRTPTSDQIAEVHALMRERLSARFADGADMALLYGGSVKPGNAAEIFAIPHVNGALVGGASLKAEDFGPIIAALSAA
ncbi:triose-phosphate isomerase [Paracoccus sp. P2]|uniref:Triosephosphate isomerase n=1 Tax=Paracoccus pantotrophus TaxID=82367 RepID=A0A7H9BT13_PARPN|nr:triose-phosphate isomerase [Paracoccus pantotrophus]MDF3852925.1 triose-phosphate isomerase [Paracoccus pantotrophus]QLH13985.1 triose-phosphate isomerase [Paracoccus pantotrophus]RDD96971.1 triose-phosphate isomerase [Paracoccus pantotrophus]RNI17398.1 triose-phosphate isomerase [Paracoccus pantotrophus]WGR66882.1 triose-phosphate isomerase [Paracoccus pantotrophus]